MDAKCDVCQMRPASEDRDGAFLCVECAKPIDDDEPTIVEARTTDADLLERDIDLAFWRIRHGANEKPS